MRRDRPTKNLLEISIYHQDTVWPRLTRCGNKERMGICDEYRLNFHIQGYWSFFDISLEVDSPNWRKCCLVFRPRLTRLSITGIHVGLKMAFTSSLTKVFGETFEIVSIFHVTESKCQWAHQTELYCGDHEKGEAALGLRQTEKCQLLSGLLGRVLH